MIVYYKYDIAKAEDHTYYGKCYIQFYSRFNIPFPKEVDWWKMSMPKSNIRLV